MLEKQPIEPQVTEYLFAKATAALRPISGSFELTPVCNFRCSMCYVRESAESLAASHRQMQPPSFWLRLAEEAKEAGMLYLLLTGGEPFLYSGFRDVYVPLSQMGFVISINTNGSAIDEDMLRLLRRYPPARINITLYGASNETYEKLCGVKNGYDRVTETILALRAVGISVKLNCSLTPDNAQDIEAIARFAEAHRLNLSFASYMFPPIRLGEERMRSHRRFTPQEMARNTVRYIRCQMGESYADRYASEMIRRIRAVPETDAFCREREGDGVRCRAGRATFWTTWEGNITPCGMMPIPSVPLSSGSFADAWRRLVEETAKIRLAPACAVCENKDICHVCAGMTYSETSDFTKRPEYLCGYVEALREELFKNEQNGGKAE